MIWHKADNDLLSSATLRLLNTTPRHLAAAAIGLLTAIRSWCSSHRTDEVGNDEADGLGFLLRLTPRQVGLLMEAMVRAGFLIVTTGGTGYALVDKSVVFVDASANDDEAPPSSKVTGKAARQRRYKEKQKARSSGDAATSPKETPGDAGETHPRLPGDAPPSPESVSGDASPLSDSPPSARKQAPKPEQEEAPPSGGSLDLAADRDGVPTTATATASRPVTEPAAATVTDPPPSQTALPGLGSDPAKATPAKRERRRKGKFISEVRDVTPEVREVYEYWRDRLAPKSQLLPERVAQIAAAFESGLTVADCQLAIDGCVKSEFHVNAGHIGLDLILRPNKVDGFMARGRGTPVTSSRFAPIQPSNPAPFVRRYGEADPTELPENWNGDEWIGPPEHNPYLNDPTREVT